MTYRFATAVMIAALAWAMPVAVSAQGANPLLAICSGMLDQSATGVSGNRDKLCNCLVRETQAQLTQPEMLAYAEAAQAGVQPPPAVMAKVMGVATQCLQEAQTK